MIAMPLISVVVPVYNMEKYLDKCVQSLLDQTLSDIEIILVDDGATDSSPRLCDEWAARDERVRVIHKENGGLSDARNKGAAAARADYVGFVDSDDYVDADMFERLYEAIRKHGVDLATCDVTYEPSGRREEFDVPGTCVDGIYVMDAETALREAVLSRLPRIWVPVKLYPRRLFEEGFSLPLGKTYEDAYTIVDLFSRVKTVSVDPCGCYHYVRHEGETITTARFSRKSFDVIDAWKNCSELAVEKFPSLREEIDFRCYWAHFTVLDKMIQSGVPSYDEGMKSVVAYLRGNYARIAENRFVGGGRKLAMRFLNVSIALYRPFALYEAKRKQKWWS